MTIPQNCLIDLHLHIDGSLSPSSARELADLCGEQLPESDKELLSLLACPQNCRDLNEYLTCFELPCRLLQTEKTLEAAANNLCRELQRIGLIYAELRFAPQKHCEKGLFQQEAVSAVLSGIKKSGFFAKVILCCMRGEENKRQNLETVNLTAEFIGKGVVACDLAGAEAMFGNDEFFDIFSQAKKLGVPFTIHAGEACGHESVRQAVEMGASRIGHGVRVAEDISVMQLLADKKIPLEICPTSNLNTALFATYKDIPIKTLMQNGVIITVNSDNMSVSATNVKTEFLRIAEAFDFSEGDIEAFLINSAEAAFLSRGEKDILKKKIEKAFTKEI